MMPHLPTAASASALSRGDTATPERIIRREDAMGHAVEIRARRASRLIGLVGATGLLAFMAAASPEATQEPSGGQPKHGGRFQFEVVESFDARYAGDTPGHVGRGGGLAVHPQVALGDAVYHDSRDPERPIGVVTGVTWDRPRESLTVEFRPRGDARIAVGDEVWLDLHPRSAVPDVDSRRPAR